MPLNIQTNYSGDVLEELRLELLTENEIVQKGGIAPLPQISFQTSLPRLQVSDNIIQKDAATPQEVGDINITERLLTPEPFMAFLKFDPSKFKSEWRFMHPDGPLEDLRLNPLVRREFNDAILLQVNHWLGRNICQGDKSLVTIPGGVNDNMFDGFITIAKNDPDVINVLPLGPITIANVKDIFAAVYNATPVAVRLQSDWKIYISYNTYEIWGNYLRSLTFKEISETEMATTRYRGRDVLFPLVGMPDDVVFAAVASTDRRTSNLFYGIDYVDDAVNPGPIYFDKIAPFSRIIGAQLRMTGGTQIYSPNETVLYLPA